MNPYEPADDVSTKVTPDDPEAFGMLGWLFALVFHAGAFRGGLEYGLATKQREDPSEWLGYLVFGNSEFGYVFAACLCGGVIAELYRVRIHDSLQTTSLTPRQIGNRFCLATAGTCLIIALVAALMG